MGASQSGACSLAVKTDNFAYTAGDMVTGKVFVYVKDATKCSGVFLRVKGAEKVYFTERRNQDNRDNDNEDRERYYQDEVSFFNVTMPLMAAQMGQLNLGQYEIPFSFTLPAGLPGIFQEEEGSSGSDSYRCSVDYEVEAYIEIPGVFSSNIRHRQLLVITAKNDSSTLAAASVEKNKKVCYLCCIPRGEIWMRAHMDKNAYMPGETANIVLEINNGSSSMIRRIDIRLVRHLRLGTRGTGWLFYKTDVLTHVEVPGLMPGESYMDSQGRSMPIILVNTDTGVPLKAEFKGSLVECTYAIEILAKIDCTPSIGLEMAVRIYLSAEAPPPAYAPPDLPTANQIDWSPVVSDSIDIPIVNVEPSAPDYTTTKM